MTYVKHLAVFALLLGFSAYGTATSRAQDATTAETPAAGDELAAMRPKDAIAALDEGRKLAAEKNYKEAVAAFNRAISLDETYVEALIGKADALRELKDYQAASNVYTQALNIDVNAVPAYIGRGEAALELGQMDIASTDFSMALQMDPNNARLLSDVGHIMVNSDPVGAIQRLDDALAINDQDARAYRDRGMAHVLLGEYEKAEADVRRSVEVDPTDHENFMVEANVYLMQNKYDPAIEALTNAINAYQPERPGDPVKYVTGYLSRAGANLRIAEQEKDSEKAQTALQAVIADADALLAVSEERPESGSAYFYKGRALRMLQRYSDAVAALTQAIEKGAGQDVNYLADAIYFRGICWYYLGEAELARGDFEQASSTGGGYQDPRIYLWIGYTHHVQGDFREAINSYNEAIAKAPNLALAHVNKGRAYMDLNEYRRAIESFNNAVRAEPTVGEHYYNVGFAYLKLREYKKASDFLNLALQQENPQPKMYRLMATALRGLGRDQLAGQYEEQARQAEARQQASGG
ncbi:MAG: tetratricopeptide repeat protein [Pirellulales bacterium]|nr:tetratricopeptide repeat protein [Pirellulales bacterium]